MTSIEKTTEGTLYQRCIESLSDEVHRPIDEVESIYHDIYRYLEQTAGIKDFVPVFAWRRTRAVFMQRDAHEA